MKILDDKLEKGRHKSNEFMQYEMQFIFIIFV